MSICIYIYMYIGMCVYIYIYIYICICIYIYIYIYTCIHTYIFIGAARRVGQKGASGSGAHPEAGIKEH